MKNGVRLLKMLGLASFLLVQPLRAQTVTNVRAQQQADKTVEVLYDLSGVAAGGTTVSIAFSSDGGETYTITPATSTLSGHVGAGLTSGTNRRIVWNAAASLPANAHGTSYKAAVTATNPSIAGQEISFELPGRVSLAMVKIPAGTFKMGSPASERGTDSDEHPVHQVTLTSDYYIGKYEVTQAQWRAVMGANPSYFKSCGGDCPVEHVSWDDIRGANGFIGKLRALLGDSKFRLPTEAEWERAARGGTQTRFSFGDALDGDDACGTNTAADPHVWWCGNAEGTTHPAGTKGPNPYGLFDMHGNVWEWVEDWYGTYPTMEQTDPPGVATSSVRTIRGGSWFGGLMYARSADRGDYGPGGSDNAIGFRLAAAGSDAAYSNVFTVDLREAACSLTCSVGVATAAVAGADISFWASATPSSCTGPISYQWSFGDPEPGAGNTSSLQNAVHRYASPGTYTWALNALTPGATCTKTGSIVVSAPPAQPPILFAHSICSGCDAWKEMAENLRSISTARYGSAPPLDLYFDGTWVRVKDDDSRYFPDRGAGYGQIEARRMYTITYFDPAAGSKSAGFDKMKVKDIPIEGLAGQLAAVVAAIRSVNHTVSVDVVSHGLGGLVTRTLIEGLGSVTSRLEAYVPGSVRQVVTIDTPHRGYPDVILGLEESALQKLFGQAGSPAELAVCFASSSAQKEQTRSLPMSAFLETLNGRNLPPSVALTAVATTGPRVALLPGLASDGIVETLSQDVKTIERYRCAPNVATIPSTASGPVAHLTVLDVMDTARIVDSILARPPLTEETGGCQAFSPSVQTALAVPNLAQDQPGARTLVLTFPAGGRKPNEVPESADSVCWATVVARADDGSELARQEVPAVGTQMVQFGILPASGWHVELMSSCAVTVFAHVDFTPADSFGAATSEAVLPIVLDVSTGSAHYTTEMSLVNSGSSVALANLKYTASLGTREGGGEIIEKLAPGSQTVVSDVLDFLRQRGLRIPSAESGQQGGTLRVFFAGAETAESVAVSARTTTATQAPQPLGAAGLAYAGVTPSAASEGSLTIYGLRDDTRDRANVAVFNPTSTPVAVRMTAFSGDGSGYSSVVRDSLSIPAFGWTQVGNVFSGTGIASGWVNVQRTSSSGRFGAYGVINDNVTNDGSFVLPTAGATSGSRVTVPVLVETPAFRSELVLANRGSSTATLTLRYAERLTPSLGKGGTATVQLRPGEQQLIPDAIDYLRRKGVAIGGMGAGSYAGALSVSVSGTCLSEVYAGARTAAPSPAGGQFGVFTPGVYESEGAEEDAYIYGLRADTARRSNLAVVNAGVDRDYYVTLEVQVYDGDRGGAPAGAPRTIVLWPGQWEQITGVLASVGVRNGWVRVRKTVGTAGWLAYGVINDGGNPGERTGDGAYVPMTTKVAAAPPPGENEVTFTLPGGVPLVMVRISAGTFQMGSPKTERGRWDDETLHPVTLTSDYYIGKYEVTQAQWRAVMGANPSRIESCGCSCPVEQVSWEEIHGANGFLERLNALLGDTKFRLPTEAEWERAARGGTQTRFSFGDALDGSDFCEANAAADPYAWWCGNETNTSHPVGTKGANPYGLHDVHGNVSEWVEDFYGSYPSTAQTNPTGPATGTNRAFRSGCWYSDLYGIRSANRWRAHPGSHSEEIGFRLARSE